MSNSKGISSHKDKLDTSEKTVHFSEVTPDKKKKILTQISDVRNSKNNFIYVSNNNNKSETPQTVIRGISFSSINEQKDLKKN